ncbi:MAG: glycosyltransferase family 2 protein [Elusimicrobia bacterium]|nr:glycosyltransferase family 2 protein [Elusimicrobiota bacterium]
MTTTSSLKPLVTVIIDTFNYGIFIEQCVDSVLNQDFPKDQLEILVIDDGSTDDTKVKISKYEKQIKYIYQKNKGQAGVFNTGFGCAQGNIICLLDADDYWYPNKLKAVCDIFEKYPDVGLVQHPSIHIDISNKVINKTSWKLPEFYDLDYFLNYRTFFYGTSNLSFRKQYLVKILPEPEEMGNFADQYLYWNTLLYSRIYNINNAFTAHRIHTSNWYAKRYSNLKMLEMHISVLERVNTIFENNLKIILPGKYAIAPAVREQEFEIIKEKIILFRKEMQFYRAIKAFLTIFRYPITKYVIFKEITLFLALLEPGLYLKLFALYSKINFISKLREKILPEKL